MASFPRFTAISPAPPNSTPQTLSNVPVPAARFPIAVPRFIDILLNAWLTISFICAASLAILSVNSNDVACASNSLSFVINDSKVDID